MRIPKVLIEGLLRTIALAIILSAIGILTKGNPQPIEELLSSLPLLLSILFLGIVPYYGVLVPPFGTITWLLVSWIGSRPAIQNHQKNINRWLLILVVLSLLTIVGGYLYYQPQGGLALNNCERYKGEDIQKCYFSKAMVEGDESLCEKTNAKTQCLKALEPNNHPGGCVNLGGFVYSLPLSDAQVDSCVQRATKEFVEFYTTKEPAYCDTIYDKNDLYGPNIEWQNCISAMAQAHDNQEYCELLGGSALNSCKYSVSSQVGYQSTIREYRQSRVSD